MKDSISGIEMLYSGELANRAGINKETLRYYEKVGLIRKVARTDGRYRIYTKEHLQRILFIREAQKLGFSLSEIKQLLKLADGGIVDCSKVKNLAKSKINRIEDQVKKLNHMHKVLTKLVHQCSITNKVNHCPIVEGITECVEFKKPKRRSK